MQRPSGRQPDQLRDIRFTRNFTRHAEGSVLVEFGDTKVLCTASVENNVPSFLRGQGRGWVTAEYSMLPGSTTNRVPREAVKGKQTGRTIEIQRLIGRSLRAAVNLETLGERSILIDCDVLQADGGTRTASITGAWVALSDALNQLIKAEQIQESPLLRIISSVSVGVYQGRVVLDLDYAEDANADTDMNVVASDDGKLIEIQGTAEGAPFNHTELTEMLSLATKGTAQIQELQKSVLAQAFQIG